MAKIYCCTILCGLQPGVERYRVILNDDGTNAGADFACAHDNLQKELFSKLHNNRLILQLVWFILSGMQALQPLWRSSLP